MEFFSQGLTQILLGALSVLNPCGLLIAISYLLLLLNVNIHHKFLFNLFVIFLLIILTFLPFGVIAGIIGEFIISKIIYVYYIYPAIIIFLGLSLIYGKFLRFNINIGTKSLYLMVPIISLSISSSCSLPIFLSSFIFALIQNDFYSAMVSITYYAIGFSFMLIFLTILARFFGKHFMYRINLRRFQIISGFILVSIGLIIYIELFIF